ncbi:hypothetical protein NMY22_g10151 [Coprinellus aureogranulatus]|nr:hypothetical protein NMY22_g10151 [Coprinellus aureogranulatus]
MAIQFSSAPAPNPITFPAVIQGPAGALSAAIISKAPQSPSPSWFHPARPCPLRALLHDWNFGKFCEGLSDEGMIDFTDPVAVARRDAADQFHTLLSFWLGNNDAYEAVAMDLLRQDLLRRNVRDASAHVNLYGCAPGLATPPLNVLIDIFMTGVNAHRFLYAFSPAWHRDSGGQLPIAYLRILSHYWDNYTSVVIMNVLTWLADALVIYRCFLIWERNVWIIIPSSLVLLLSIVNCSVTITWFRHPTLLTYPQARPFLNMTYPINIAQSCLTTGLITFKIWRQYSLSRSAGLYAGGSGSGLLTIMRIIVESAMIFAVQQLALCILYYLDSPAQHVFHGTMVPSIGVVFVLLAIRAYGVTHPDTLPNIRWPHNSNDTPSQSGQTTSTSPFPSNANLNTSERSARIRHHRRTASDGLMFATSARSDTHVTLTIPDTNIYSSGRNSANAGDIEKGDLSGRSVADASPRVPASSSNKAKPMMDVQPELEPEPQSSSNSVLLSNGPVVPFSRQLGAEAWSRRTTYETMLGTQEQDNETGGRRRLVREWDWTEGNDSFCQKSTTLIQLPNQLLEVLAHPRPAFVLSRRDTVWLGGATGWPSLTLAHQIHPPWLLGQFTAASGPLFDTRRTMDILSKWVTRYADIAASRMILPLVRHLPILHEPSSSSTLNKSEVFFPGWAPSLNLGAGAHICSVKVSGGGADQELTFSDVDVSSTATNVITRGSQKYACKCYPGDKCWPSTSVWSRFNITAGGTLQVALPPGASCYNSLKIEGGAGGEISTFDSEKCAEVQRNWIDEQWNTDHPISNLWPYWTNDTCLPFPQSPSDTCTRGYYGAYVVLAKTHQHVKATIDFARQHNIRLVIRNTGHDFMGRSTGYGSLILNTHSFKDVTWHKRWTGAGNWRGGAVTVGAGIQGRELWRLANKQSPPQALVTGECPTVGFAGGFIQGGGHGPLASLYGLAADQALSFDVVTSSGEYLTANAAKNPSLFWALKGGGPSTFAAVLSVTVKTFPRSPECCSHSGYQLHSHPRT